MAIRDAVVGQFHDELASPKLEEMKDQLRKDVTNTTLPGEIRQLDKHLRRAYFARQRRMELAGIGTIVCGGLFLLWGNVAVWCRRRLPRPGAPVGIDVLALGRLSRAAVTVFGVIVLGASLALGIAFQPWKAPVEEIDTSVVGPPAGPEEMARNWPRFRGPDGLGIAHTSNVPMDWDGKSGKGVLWKTRIPLGGDGSCVVWDKKVFVTGANKDARAVYCLDADTGKMLWEVPVENVPGSTPLDEENPLSGFAPSTVCTDGRRVFAIFTNLDLIALSLDGKLQWKKSLAPVKINYGYATSLMTVGDKLLLQVDQADETDNKSFLLALDSATGKEAWRVKRPGVGSSWASPSTIDTPGGKQIVTASLPFVIAHDAADGHELWRVKALDGDVAPSPAFGAGMIFSINKGTPLVAIKTDGHGDVTKTHVAWKYEDEEPQAIPEISSPASDGKYVYLPGNSGMVTCVDIATGKQAWQRELTGEMKASAIVAGDKVVVMNSGGKMTFLAAGGEYKLLGTAALGEETGCTPAILEGRIYLRGNKHVYGIGGGK